MYDNQSPQSNSSDVQSQDSEGGKSKLGIVISVLVIAIVLFIIFDPFGIIARLQGTGDSLAKFVPADSVFYMNVDLLQVTSDETEDIFNAFQRGAGVTYGEGETLVEQIDRSLEELFDLTYSEDIEPWVGQYLAVSVSNLVLGDWGNMESGDVLIIVEAIPTQEEKVDEFILKLVAAMEESSDISFEKIEYDAVALYEYQSGYPGEAIVIGRYKNNLFISNSSQNIISSINLESSQSLAKDDDYQTIIKEIPGKRMMTISMKMDGFVDVLSIMAADLGESIAATANKWAVFSISTKNYGLEFNTAFIQDLKAMTESQKDAIVASQNFDLKTDEMFPEETILYFVGYGLDKTINLLLEDENIESQDIKESLDLLKQGFGIDILRLINAFDGEFAMGLVQNSDGFLSASVGGELGVELEFIIGTSQEDLILDEFKKLKFLAGLDPSISIEEYSKNNMSLFDFEMDDGFQMINYMTYGVGGGYVVFSTSSSLVDDSFDGGPTLADNPRYIEALNSFPKGYQLSFFMDVHRVLNIFKEDMDGYLSESISVFEPITAMAGGVEVVDSVNITTFIIFIETE